MTNQERREQMDVTELLAEAVRLTLPKVNLPKGAEDEVRVLLDTAIRKAKEDQDGAR